MVWHFCKLHGFTSWQRVILKYSHYSRVFRRVHGHTARKFRNKVEQTHRFNDVKTLKRQLPAFGDLEGLQLVLQFVFQDFCFIFKIVFFSYYSSTFLRCYKFVQTSERQLAGLQLNDICFLCFFFYQETYYWQGDASAAAVVMSGVRCSGTELTLDQCLHHGKHIDCPKGGGRFAAGVSCTQSKKLWRTHIHSYIVFHVWHFDRSR